MGVAAELLNTQAGVAGDLDVADASLYAGVDLELDIDKLTVGMGSEGLLEDGLVEAVLSHGLLHLLERGSEPCLRVAGSGDELAGALELGVEGRSLGSVDADDSEEDAGSAAKDEVDAVGGEGSFSIDGLVEAGGVELAEASPEAVCAEGLALGLRQLSGEWIEAIGGDAFKGDVADGNAGPLDEGRSWREFGRWGGLGVGNGFGKERQDEPKDECACGQNPAQKHPAIAAFTRRLSPQIHFSQKARGTSPVCATLTLQRKKSHRDGFGRVLPKLHHFDPLPLPLILARTGALRSL